MPTASVPWETSPVVSCSRRRRRRWIRLSNFFMRAAKGNRPTTRVFLSPRTACVRTFVRARASSCARVCVVSGGGASILSTRSPRGWTYPRYVYHDDSSDGQTDACIRRRPFWIDCECSPRQRGGDYQHRRVVTPKTDGFSCRRFPRRPAPYPPPPAPFAAPWPPTASEASVRARARTHIRSASSCVFGNGAAQPGFPSSRGNADKCDGDTRGATTTDRRKSILYLRTERSVDVWEEREREKKEKRADKMCIRRVDRSNLTCDRQVAFT